MSLENQIELLTAEVAKIGVQLSKLTGLPQTTVSNSSAGEKEEKPKADSPPGKSEAKPKTAAKEKVTPKTETAKKALTPKVKEDGDGLPEAATATFEELSRHFFSYLATARGKLGRDKAKVLARELLDTHQSQKGAPLDVVLLDEDKYCVFYADIDDAFEALTDGD